MVSSRYNERRGQKWEELECGVKVLKKGRKVLPLHTLCDQSMPRLDHLKMQRSGQAVKGE